MGCPARAVRRVRHAGGFRSNRCMPAVGKSFRHDLDPWKGHPGSPRAGMPPCLKPFCGLMRELPQNPRAAGLLVIAGTRGFAREFEKRSLCGLPVGKPLTARSSVAIPRFRRAPNLRMQSLHGEMLRIDQIVVTEGLAAAAYRSCDSMQSGRALIRPLDVMANLDQLFLGDFRALPPRCYSRYRRRVRRAVPRYSCGCPSLGR